MSFQTIYLAMVIAGFAVFGLALAWGAWWSSRPVRPRAPTVARQASPEAAARVGSEA